jgi:hypothetical protein
MPALPFERLGFVEIRQKVGEADKYNSVGRIPTNVRTINPSLKGTHKTVDYSSLSGMH